MTQQLTTKRPRRFIAGASCPACRGKETIYFVDASDDSVACIDCNYTAHRPGTKLESVKANAIKAVPLKILATPAKFVDENGGEETHKTIAKKTHSS